MPESKQKLQTFLDRHYLLLRYAYPTVKEKLHQVIRDTFPKESLEAIGNILYDHSEYAIVVKNCPERKGFAYKERASYKEAYSHFLSRALYEMHDAEHIESIRHFRRSHKTHTQKIVGGDLHSDIATKRRGFFPRETKRSRYVIISCPHNEEHGLTEVINVRQALEEIPKPEREKTFVDVTIHDTKDEKRISLEELYQNLLRPIEAGKKVRIKKIYNSIYNGETRQWEIESPQLMQAMERYSTKVDIQPGDLLIFDQQSLFHQAHLGDTEIIDRIPSHHRYSRMVIHSAGTPVAHR